MYLFDVASRHMTWLANRQMVTASNIANADTPGFRAREAEPFSAYLDAAPLRFSATSPGHLQLSGSAAGASRQRLSESWDQAHSGNNVSIEKELMTASSNSRMMNLDTSLAKSFHRMLLTSVKV